MKHLCEWIAVVVVLVAVAPALASESPTEVSTVPAVWQEHEIILRYQGFTTHYSCTGMRAKVKAILRHLGARDDMRVTSYGCAALDGRPAPVANVKLRFATLQPAGDDTGGSRVTARWDEVRLASQRPRDLSRGDCTLVERFRDDVLPAFASEVVADRTRCIPHRLDASAPNLRLRVLRPLRD